VTRLLYFFSFFSCSRESFARIGCVGHVQLCKFFPIELNDGTQIDTHARAALRCIKRKETHLTRIDLKRGGTSIHSLSKPIAFVPIK
jgi:hypothetical protein